MRQQTDATPSSPTRDRPAASHTPQSRQTPRVTPRPVDGGRRAPERCEKMPRPWDTRPGALGRPATLGACCGAPQALEPLASGRPLDLAGCYTAPTAPRVPREPIVGGNPRCLVAQIGLLCPQ